MKSFDKLLQNISSEIFIVWQELNLKPTELLDQLEKLDGVVNKIKLLNEEKKSLSAKIGRLKKAGEDISELVTNQASIKKILKQHKQDKNNIETNIIDFFKNLAKHTPIRFTKQHDDSQSDTFSRINIFSATKIDDELIDEFLDSQSHTTPYHYSCWRRLIRNLFKHKDLSIVAVNQSNQIQGYLPLIRLKSYLFGDFLVSMPYFNYGGPIAKSSYIEQRLINSAIELAQQNNLEHIEIRELIDRDELESKTEKVSMIRELPKSTETLANEIGTKLRAQIKRSDAEKPIFKVGKKELLEDFYLVFSTNMRDLGTPVYSKDFFSNVIDSWYENSYIVVIYIEEQPVACALLIGFREMLEIPWASALKKTNRSGINMFMYWNILKFAIENNYDFFDFGRSSKESGTYNFKKQWGAIPYQNYWNYWVPDGENLPQINPNNTKYKLLISTWKKLPLVVSNSIGPSIVKNIP